MRGHFSSSDIERFVARDLPPSQLLAFYDHISECAKCRDEVNLVMQPQNVLASVLAGLTGYQPGDVEHLRYQQIEGYVDATLTGAEREMSVAHLELCRDCAERVDELRSFKNSLSKSDPDESGFWQKLSNVFRRPNDWLLVPVQIAVIAFVIISLQTLVVRKEMRELQSQSDKLRQENELLRKDAASAQELEASLQRLQREQQETQATVADLQARLRDSVNTSEDRSRDLLLNDRGGSIRINKLGEVSGLGALSARDQRAVRAAVVSQHLEAPGDQPELAMDQSALLRGGKQGVAFTLISPLGRVVETDRPAFHWGRLNGASSYIVSVFDSRFNRVAVSPPLKGTQWRADPPLARGGVYSWQVSATRSDETIKSPTTPAPEARFKVLDAAAAAELENARRNYHGSRLMLGLVFTRLGLLDQAELEFKELRKANPRSPIAAGLFRSLKKIQAAKRQ